MQTNLLKPKAINVEQLGTNRAKVTLEPVGSTPAEFAALIMDYHVRYGRLVRELGIKIE